MNVLHIVGPERSLASDITFGSTLKGTAFTFRLQWLTSLSYWVLTVTAPGGEVFLRSARVIVGVDMTLGLSSTLIPDGQLVCYDTSGKTEPPGRDDFRERHVLIFIEDPEPEQDEPVRVTLTPE